MINILTLFNPRWWMLKKRFSIDHQGPFVEVNENGYLIAIVSRGEELLYEDIVGVYKLQISLQGRWVHEMSKNSICSEARRSLILKRVKNYFEKYQGFKIRVINDD